MTITIQKRTASASTCRSQQLVPGVLYGPRTKNELICLPQDELIRLTKEGAGQLTSYNFDGSQIEGILQETQLDAVTGRIVHFDLYLPALDEAITTTIPLHFLHTEELEKLGFMINKTMTEIEIEALPKNIPHHLTVDLEPLHEAHQSLYVRDLILPKGVTVTISGDTPLATLLPSEQ